MTEERASGSEGPPRTGATGGAATSAGSGRARRTSGALQVGHGVDAWRFLLGLDVESFEAGVDVVALGQPLLPEYVQAMITETIANYDLTDRCVMTAAFVTYLRMMMTEVMVAFERGVAAGGARERDEILVDVVVEDDGNAGDEAGLMQVSLVTVDLGGQGHDGDEASFMQRTLTGQFQGAAASRWSRALQGLQDDLGMQAPALRNANIAGLQARLSSAAPFDASYREPLQALLVGMQECGFSEAAVGDVGWQISWWGRLVTAIQMELTTDRPAVPSSPTQEEVLTMAEDEREVQVERASEQEARRRQEEDHDKEEEAFMNYQMGLLPEGPRGDEAGTQAAGSTEKPPRLSAQALRAWEDWEWHNILQEPPRQRRRTMLAVTVGGSQSVDGPWLSRTIRVPCSRDPRSVHLKFDLTFEEEMYPDDVETVVLPEPHRGSCVGGLPDSGATHEAEAVVEYPSPDDVETVVLPEAHRGGVDGGLPDRGATHGVEATLEYPANALPAAQSDGATVGPVGADGENQVQSSGEAGPAPTVDLDPSSEGQLLADGTLMDVTWSDYESLYEQWKMGLVDDSTVRQAGGRNLLDLMQTQYILDMDESLSALSSSTTTTSSSTVASRSSSMPTSTESLLG